MLLCFKTSVRKRIAKPTVRRVSIAKFSNFFANASAMDYDHQALQNCLFYESGA